MAPAIRLAPRRLRPLRAEEARNSPVASASPASPSPPTSSSATATSTSAGDTFQQPDLAATLARIAANPDDFYRGDMAAADRRLRNAEGRRPHHRRRPRRLRGQGPHAAHRQLPRLRNHHRAAALLRRHRPARNPQHPLRLQPREARPGPQDRSAPQVHLITEAFRRAYMDRADYLGDPDFTPHAAQADGRPRLRRRLAQTPSIPAKPTPSADLARPAGFLPPPPAARARRPRVHPDHPLLHRRYGGQRRRQHLHPQRRLRLRRHRRRPRLPHEQRDGRLRLQAGRPQHATASSRAPPTPSPPASARSPP